MSRGTAFYIMKALKETEKWMSLFVRLRDAIEWNKQFQEDISILDPKSLCVNCCSCGRIGNWFYKMEAGHFIPKGSRGESGVRFDERNVHAQCKTCNGFKQGNTLNYGDFMREKYGQEVIDELRRDDLVLKHQRGQTELMAIALHYKQLYNELLEKYFI